MPRKKLSQGVLLSGKLLLLHINASMTKCGALYGAAS